MRSTLLVITALGCLAFVVYVRTKTIPTTPTLSIAKVDAGTLQPAELAKDSPPCSQLGVAVDDVCLDVVPDKTKELGTVLQYLHSSTIQAFETSPRFGGNRGGFGGGQFGNAGGGFGGSYAEPKQAAKPAPRPRKHSRIPEPDPMDRRHLFHGIKSTKVYDEQWTWLEEMRGITGRGFVYKSNDRQVVGMPVEPTLDQFIDHVIDSDPSNDLAKGERVWDVVELQLVGLVMHSEPVVFDKHLMMNEEGKPLEKRELDKFETESLVNLRAGAERVIAWNAEENCLRVLGAIRAKENCMKCHDVKAGFLLGAFTYRIKEVTVD